MNNTKLQKFNLGTLYHNFIDGIYSDLFALNLSIMEMSSLYGYPSDINEYHTKLDVLIKLFEALCGPVVLKRMGKLRFPLPFP